MADPERTMLDRADVGPVVAPAEHSHDKTEIGAHADSHAEDGSDPVSPESIGAVSQASSLAELIADAETSVERVERGQGRVWRQDTPPPAGTTYRWAGERWASLSEKVDGSGTTVLTNHHKSPSFEKYGAGSVDGGTPNASYGINAEHSSDGSLFGGRHLRIYGATAQATRHEWVGSLPAGTYTAYGHFRVDDVRDGLISGGWGQVTESSSGDVIEHGESATYILLDNADGEWHRGTPITFTLAAPTSVRIRWYTGLVDVSLDGFTIHEGDTPVDYFDGDSLGDRANDLWINTGENGKPYVWDNLVNDWTPASDASLAVVAALNSAKGYTDEVGRELEKFATERAREVFDDPRLLDTGWRVVTPAGGWSGTLMIRRVGHVVYLGSTSLVIPASGIVVLDPPAGFGPAYGTRGVVPAYNSIRGTSDVMTVSVTAVAWAGPLAAGDTLQFQGSWLTDETFPAEPYPGTPA